MNRYLLLHYGFEKPTPEIMDAWTKWFESVADVAEEHGGFHSGGREITHDGTNDLPFAADSITGYSIIKAENLDAAEEIAGRNPFIASIRVYEISQQ
ncbi:MAG: YciI family protein [Woeseiaceae bacterium]|nr:YciI family protein [Woeseiaceae bacterium]